MTPRLTRRRRTGAAILEMAITLMVLLSLSFGTVEFGYFFFLKNAVQAAAREGARAAILPGGTNTQVTTAVNLSLNSAGLNTPNYAITVKVNGVVADASTATPGQQIEVSVTATWGTVGMRPLGLINSNKTLLGAANMRREG
jgi:Flp pilus assembly protein TadG